MKEIIINDHQLKDEDIESKVVRVKGLILNSKGKILLAYNNNTYQFPGGHKEDNEGMNECIVREIKEETGIKLTVSEEPFLCIETYDSDYFGTGKKVINSIYYYRFFTDEVPNFEETQYDELELATEFHLFYVSFNHLESFLRDRLLEGKMDPNIAREMIHVVNEYHILFDNE
jgi:8-oxo-dGTP pyrophosphatase MutT (NUDIX family)